MSRLFKDKILRKKLENYSIPDFEEKISILKEWHGVHESGDLKKKTESQCEQSFNHDIFVRVLGYTKFPSSPYTIEPKADTETSSQKPDAVLGYFEADNKNIAAVVEIKDANKALEKPQQRIINDSPIQQAFKYKSQYRSCPFVIATNFIEIRLFRDNQLDFEMFQLETLVDPEDNYYQFRKFYYLLNAENFTTKQGKSITEGILSDIRIEQEEITKQFYKDYKLLRQELLRQD